MSTDYSPNMPIVQELISDIIAVMAELGDDYSPPEDSEGDTPTIGEGLQDFGLTPARLEALRDTYEAWPKGVLRGFHQASEALVQTLQMFGAPLIASQLRALTSHTRCRAES